MMLGWKIVRTGSGKPSKLRIFLCVGGPIVAYCQVKIPNCDSLYMEVIKEMTEKEQIAILIDQYTDLQRIKVAADREKEVEYQIRKTKAKLEAMGIIAEDLNI